MTMLSIDGFFKRIGGFYAREAAFRAAIQSALKESIGLEVPVDSISFRSGVVELKNISQAARSAIFTKKAPIIERMNAAQSVHNISDVR